MLNTKGDIKIGLIMAVTKMNAPSGAEIQNAYEYFLKGEIMEITPMEIMVFVAAVVCIASCFVAMMIMEQTIKRLNKQQCGVNQPMVPQNSEMNDNYLVDFREDRFANMTPGVLGTPITIGGDSQSDQSEPPKTKKVTVRPIDVVNELIRPPTQWSLEGIDAKIDILKDKEKLINQHYAKREVSGLILCLENRKKYDDQTESGETFRMFFSQFDTTSEEKIAELLSTYTLVRNSADIFIPEFPDEAIVIMNEYTDKVEELCEKKPQFSVIAEEKDFKKQYDKRDPILLTQSPFGFYYYILGAWDKEMILLSEL